MINVNIIATFPPVTHIYPLRLMVYSCSPTHVDFTCVPLFKNRCDKAKQKKKRSKAVHGIGFVCNEKCASIKGYDAIKSQIP